MRAAYTSAVIVKMLGLGWKFPHVSGISAGSSLTPPRPALRRTRPLPGMRPDKFADKYAVESTDKADKYAVELTAVEFHELIQTMR